MDSQEMQDFFLLDRRGRLCHADLLHPPAPAPSTRRIRPSAPGRPQGPEDPRAGYEEPDRYDELPRRYPRCHVLRRCLYSLQTGIIDGTENNETALTTGKHGEVCKVYSVDQHAMIPDVLIMSEKGLEDHQPGGSADSS